MRLRALVVALAGAACGPAPAVELAPCPVRDEGCRERVFLALEQMRGQTWDPWTGPPPVQVITLPQYRAMGRVPESVDRAGADPTVASEPLYYDRERNRLVLVEDGAGSDDATATSALVHEYVHLAQDRELNFGLSLGSSGDSDWQMVRGSIMEGEAVLYQTLAELRMAGVDPRAHDFRAQFRSELASLRQALATSPSWWDRARLGMRYPAGALFVADAWARDGSVGVEQLMLHPPQAFAQLMLAIEGRPAVVARQAPRCGLSANLAAEVSRVDSYGAGLLYAWLARTMARDEDAWQAALTWRGDCLWSLLDANGTKASFWSVYGPGLRDTPLGAELAARTTPPVLIDDHLIGWWADTPALAEAVRAASTCVLPAP